MNGKGVPFVLACRKGDGAFNNSACYGRVVDAVDVLGFLVEVVDEVYDLLFAIIKCYLLFHSAFVLVVES